MDKQSARRRGRPIEVDRDQVAEIALFLFEEKGFDDVTMSEIAKQAEVSRRTLFRLFPSKADLVWDGIWDIVSAMKDRVEALEAAASSLSLSEIIDELLVPGLAMLADPQEAAQAKRRLRLATKAPSLFNHPCFDEMRRLLGSLMKNCVDSLKVPPELAANILSSVAISSVLWWASEEEQQSNVTAVEALYASLEMMSTVGLDPKWRRRIDD